MTDVGVFAIMTDDAMF